jgi:sulfate permease, SulP family
VMIPAEGGRLTRVRSLGRYTTIGEMGLVSGAPRSATIQAEVASVLYVLSTPQFEAIKVEQPQLGQKLLTYFMTVMAERLTFANRHLGVAKIRSDSAATHSLSSRRRPGSITTTSCVARKPANSVLQ